MWRALKNCFFFQVASFSALSPLLFFPGCTLLHTVDTMERFMPSILTQTNFLSDISALPTFLFYLWDTFLEINHFLDINMMDNKSVEIPSFAIILFLRCLLLQSFQNGFFSCQNPPQLLSDRTANYHSPNSPSSVCNFSVHEIPWIFHLWEHSLLLQMLLEQALKGECDSLQ
jgi:hypothetical protein